MKITNFEIKYAINSLIKFFFIFGIRELNILFDYKIKGKTTITSTKYEDTIAAKPNMSAILKALFWILLNSKYLQNKRKKIHEYRKISTKELQKMNYYQQYSKISYFLFNLLSTKIIDYFIQIILEFILMNIMKFKLIIYYIINGSLNY